MPTHMIFRFMGLGAKTATDGGGVDCYKYWSTCGAKKCIFGIPINKKQALSYLMVFASIRAGKFLAPCLKLFPQQISKTIFVGRQ